MISKATERRGVPLRPAWDEYQRVPFLARAALAYARHAFDPNQSSGPAEIARRTWPGDETTHALTIVSRAAVPPMGTSTTSAFSQIGLAEFLASLAPISAAANLFASAPRVSLGRLASITFPRRSAALDPTTVGWIDEGEPAIVPRLNIAGGSVLGPTKKLAAIVAATRELVEASDAESALDLMLRESASLALDAAVFSTAAATSARPAGLLAGIAPLTAAAGTSKDANLDDNVAALAEAISAATTGLVFVMHSSQANSVKVRRGTQWRDDVLIWPTIGVTPGVVIALDPRAIVVNRR